MTRGLQTFLTFQGGGATAALELYGEVFDDFEVLEITRYGPGEGGPEGTVMVATFRLADTRIPLRRQPRRSRLGLHTGDLTVDRLRRRRANSNDSSPGCPTAARCSCPSTTTGSAPASAGSAIHTASPGSSICPDPAGPDPRRSVALEFGEFEPA